MRERSRRFGIRLAWLLRHGATEAGLAMDEAGWASVAAVAVAMGCDLAALDREVARDDKARFERAGDRVRACQGHSFAGTPVRREALEASWAVVGDDGPARLWHGTQAALLDVVRREGLRPMDRTHVHLAGAMDDRVGKRARVDVLLGVDAAALRAHGRAVFRSPNGVYLVRDVPAACIVEVV